MCAFRRASSLAYDFIEGRRITVHDFIGTIFYFFRNAIPLALIGLAAGAVILVMLNLKCRREGKCFPKGQAVTFLLLLCYLGGLAAITLMNRMDGMRTGVQLLPFLAFWEAWNNFCLLYTSQQNGQQHHLYQHGSQRSDIKHKRLSIEWDQQQCIE